MKTLNFMKFKNLFSLTINVCLAAVLTRGVALAQSSASTNSGATSLPDVVVTGKTSSYETQNAAAQTATKMDVPILDVPASVQSVTKQVLEDRGVTKISQFSDTVSDVHAESTYGGNQGAFFNVRGFSSANSLRDGFRAEGNLASRDVQNIERIDVLKGPAGALYTSMSAPGGVINTISKRPEDATWADLSLTGGSFGLVRPTADMNARLGESDDLLGRLNLAYEHNDTFRKFGEYWSYAVAPGLTWNIGPNSSLTVLTEYNHLNQDAFDFGVFNDPLTLARPRWVYYGLPRYDHGRNDTLSATLLFEHKLNDDWKWRESANFNQAWQRTGQTFAYSISGMDNVGVNPFSVPEFTRDYALQSDLEGKFSTGKINHTVLTGVDLSSATRGGDPFYQAYATMNLLAPNYNTTFDPATLTLEDAYDNTIYNVGIYAQDLMELGPQWKLFGGLRVDWYESDLTPHMSGDTIIHDDFSNISPRAGIVYQPLTNTSVYFSWGRSSVTVAQSEFNPPGTPIANSGFQPELSQQYEAGVKHDFLDGKVSSTLAAYQIERSHVLTQDPSNPLKQIQVGEQRSRGIDFDLGGQIINGWRAIATYAYCDAKVTRDNTIPVGDRLANVPRNSGSLWSTYRFQEGALKGLGMGLGEVYVGEREAMLPNTFKLASYWRTDAALYYTWQKWKAQVNFLNIFDKTYFVGGATGTYDFYVRPGQPFSVQATLSYRL